jgi:DNA-binding SARP family transcriptional activator
MEFRLLGPLEVLERDRSLPLGGVKPRSLLAILLLHTNEVVSTDRLHAALWGEAAPATAAKSIHVYVSRLRAQLGADRLTTRPPGYVLHVDPSELDLARFERLLAEARSAEPKAAAGKLREALALWRGDALADLAYEPFAQSHVQRLEELRLVVIEERIDADLAAGRAAELVGELEALVAEHPLRERLRGQLMLALYRSARQAEALSAYQVARRELSEQLGLEPSAELRRLEQSILRQDPALDPRARAGPGPVPARDRCILVFPAALEGLDALLRLATPLAAAAPERELIVAAVVASSELRATTAALAARGGELRARGVAARSAAFASPDPGADVARLAVREGVDLLVMDAGGPPLQGEARAVLERAPCDVAVLLRTGDAPRDGPVVVPFGAAEHDWAALELGAWLARATGAPLRLMGAAAVGDYDNGRDASRLLADASLIVQRQVGVVAAPLLARPGRTGLMGLAEGAGLLVVGLSDRWSDEGLGAIRTELAAAPPAPTVFVRRGRGPGGLAPADAPTRFGWSVTGAAR